MEAPLWQLIFTMWLQMEEFSNHHQLCRLTRPVVLVTPNTGCLPFHMLCLQLVMTDFIWNHPTWIKSGFPIYQTEKKVVVMPVWDESADVELIMHVLWRCASFCPQMSHSWCWRKDLPWCHHRRATPEPSTLAPLTPAQYQAWYQAPASCQAMACRCEAATPSIDNWNYHMCAEYKRASSRSGGAEAKGMFAPRCGDI